jgi:MoaA/NifB/PqqE/SkfB family radical SAM enzyme
MNDKSKTFCMHPFTGLATREDGAIQVCCRSHPIGWIQKDSLENIWNNDNMKRIRRQVLSGDRPSECAPCFNLEDQGVESLRQRHIKGQIPEARINLYPNALDALDADYKMPFEIPTMELKLNNLCNLKCRMCHPMDSTSWNDWNSVEEFYANENNFMVKAIKDLELKTHPYLDKFTDNTQWWTDLEKLLPYFRRAEFAGGEPLMDPTHFRILDMMAPYGKNIEIKYATNLSVLGIKNSRTVWEYWPKFKSVAVNVSIDGIEETYEYIRGNAKWKTLVSNIREIKKIENISRIVGAVAVQVGNAMVLDKMIEVFLDELGIVFYTNMVNYPNVLSIQVLPTELKKEVISRLERVRSRVGSFKLAKENPIVYDITLAQIDGIINFIQSKDASNLWSETIRFNKILDSKRNQGPLEFIIPEFAPYV